MNIPETYPLHPLCYFLAVLTPDWDETQIGKGDLVVHFEELAEKVKGNLKMPKVQEQVVSDDGDDGDWEVENDEDEELEDDVEEALRLLLACRASGF